MGTTVLVESDIEKGKDVVRALDEAGVKIRTALWHFLSEAAEWRLVLATPIVDHDGPRAAYEAVRRVLAERGVDSPLLQITLVSPRDPLIKQLRSAVTTPPGAIKDIRFTNNVVGNILIEDAHIYRSCGP